MRIAVTGGSGKLGKTVVRELRAAGHAVVNLDLAGERGPGFVSVNLTDYGQVIDALAGVNDRHDGVDALVHLAAIPAPGILSAIGFPGYRGPLLHAKWWLALYVKCSSQHISAGT